MQGLRILKNEAYIRYAAVMKDERNAADGLFPDSSDEVDETMVLLPFHPHGLTSFAEGLESH